MRKQKKPTAVVMPDSTPPMMRESSGKKYLRTIRGIQGTSMVDVYSVLEAFDVRCPARQHAIKKLLCAGLRGKGDQLQDLKESADAIARALVMEGERLNDGKEL